MCEAPGRGVWGPNARDLVQGLSPHDLSNEAFPYLTAREIELDDVLPA